LSALCPDGGHLGVHDENSASAFISEEIHLGVLSFNVRKIRSKAYRNSIVHVLVVTKLLVDLPREEAGRDVVCSCHVHFHQADDFINKVVTWEVSTCEKTRIKEKRIAES
jgi:hypothetical protein